MNEKPGELRNADFGLRIGQSELRARATGHDRRSREANHGSRTTSHESRVTRNEKRTTQKLIGRAKPFAPNAVVALGLGVMMERRWTWRSAFSFQLSALSRQRSGIGRRGAAVSLRRSALSGQRCGQNRSRMTTSSRGSWPALGRAGLAGLPTTMSMTIRWSAGRLISLATLSGSKPIMGHES